MRAKLLRRLTAALIGLAVATGVLTLAPIPANAASFGVTIAVSHAVVSQGEKVTIAGAVSPRPSSRYVYLQQRDAGVKSWRTVKRIRTSSSGAYKVSITAENAVDRFYRIYKPRQGKRKAGYSASRRVIVNPVVVRIASTSLARVSPASGPLSGGQKITLSGSGLTGTTRVTFTPLVPSEYTLDNTGVLPELEATISRVDDNSVELITPASLGGPSLMKVYAPSATLTAEYTYVTTAREATSFEAQVLDEINARRATAQTCGGRAMPAVGGISWQGRLADVALAHARDLAARQDLYQGISHETYRLDTFAERFYSAGFKAPFGEILEVSGARSTAADIVQGWMDSPGHCASIMNRSWTRAGVGVAAGTWHNRSHPQDSLFSNVDFQ